MAPAPTSDRPFPKKKSLRIWWRNNGHMERNKRTSYWYPRTVEAAADPFISQSGKNKMFFMIAINLFPDNKIVKPDETDSEPEDVTNQNSKKEETPNQPVITTSSKTLARRTRKRVMKARKRKAYQSENLLQTESQRLESIEAFNRVSADQSSEHSFARPLPAKRFKRAGSNNLTQSNKIKTVNVLSKGKSITPPKTGKTMSPETKKITKANVKKALPLRQFTPSAVPEVASMLNKIIQDCSDKGRISFKLSPEACRRQSS